MSAVSRTDLGEREGENERGVEGAAEQQNKVMEEKRMEWIWGRKYRRGDMSRRLFYCKSLGLGCYPALSQMFRSSGFLIFKQKYRENIF